MIFAVVVASKIEMIFFFKFVYGVASLGVSISSKLATVEFSICDAIKANLSISVVTLPNKNQCSTRRNHASISSVLNGGNGTRAVAIVVSSAAVVGDGGGVAGGGFSRGGSFPVVDEFLGVVATVEVFAVSVDDDFFFLPFRFFDDFDVEFPAAVEVVAGVLTSGVEFLFLFEFDCGVFPFEFDLGVNCNRFGRGSVLLSLAAFAAARVNLLFMNLSVDVFH